jgi:hypothetical protein
MEKETDIRDGDLLDLDPYFDGEIWEFDANNFDCNEDLSTVFEHTVWFVVYRP